jgi:hypothetical protein
MRTRSAYKYSVPGMLIASGGIRQGSVKHHCQAVQQSEKKL